VKFKNKTYLLIVNVFKLHVLLLLAFNSCHPKKEENTLKSIVESPKKIKIGQQNTTNYIDVDSIELKANELHSQLNFKFNVDSLGNTLKSIVIYSDLIKIQEISTNKSIEKPDFLLIDWDFDGFKDITVLYNCGSGGCTYWIWSYSKESKKYYYNKELSEVLGLEIDTAHKFIIIHTREGFQKENWDAVIYANYKLNFVTGLSEERWDDLKGNSWIKRTKKHVMKNKIISISDSSMVK
jgi:hypothetical protein